MTEDEDDDGEGGIGSFTSTVCVNFSEDDLRLATIPGQVKVQTVVLFIIQGVPVKSSSVTLKSKVLCIGTLCSTNL